MSRKDAQETLRMMSRVGRLESLPRTGWIVAGVQNPESVAAHVYEVAVLALWLADRVDEEVDIARVARIALAHDAGEALLTDLPAPVKQRIGRAAVGKAEREAVAEVFLRDSGWMKAHGAYEHAESAEARLVKAADKIQMLVRALQYDKQGRGDVGRFFAERPGDYGFELVAEILDEIERHHRNGTWFESDLD